MMIFIAIPMGIMRVVFVFPVIATFVVMLALFYYGIMEAWNLVLAVIEPHSGEAESASGLILYKAIKVVDIFLLATVVQVVAVGLFQLNFMPDEFKSNMPNWLHVETLEELKSKVIGVIATMLGVSFLGAALLWDGEIEILYLGGAVAIVILALGYLLSKVDSSIHHKH